MTATGKTIMKWSILLLLFAYCITMSVWAKGEADRHVCEGIDIEVKGNRNMDTVVVRGVAKELAKVSLIPMLRHIALRSTQKKTHS